MEHIRTMHELHLLLRSARIYVRQHPSLLQSLDSAYESMRSIVANMNGLEIRVQRTGLVAPKFKDSVLPDARGDLFALAKDFQRLGVYNLVFAPKFHVGALDTLAQPSTSSFL